MVRPHDLVVGNCYFHTNFYDDDLLLPSIDTLIFKEVDEDEDGQRNWLFEYPDSGLSEMGNDDVLFCITEDQLYQIIDFAGLIRFLNGISPLHLIAPAPTQSIVGISEAAQSELKREIEGFIGDQAVLAVTITIKFTDDALSISKRDGGKYQNGFYPNPFECDADKRILAQFSARNIKPHTDYLASRGRTRVLNFAIPDVVEGMLEICRAVFVDLYAMKVDDSFRFSPLLKQS
jgi:hypothetical protein